MKRLFLPQQEMSAARCAPTSDDGEVPGGKKAAVPRRPLILYSVGTIYARSRWRYSTVRRKAQREGQLAKRGSPRPQPAEGHQRVDSPPQVMPAAPIVAATPAPAEAQAADIRPVARAVELDRQAVRLICVDFTKIYDVYIFQMKERSDSLRLFVAVVSAPFIILSALGLSQKINLSGSDLFQLFRSFPSFLFAIFFLSGMVGLVPFHRFWAAHCQAYKMIRYLNNFRQLYYSYFEQEFRVLNWRPRAECDPNYPIPRIRLHWVPAAMIAMGVMNTLYITIGVALFDGSTRFLGAIVACIFSTVVHWSLWNTEKSTDDLSGKRISAEPERSLT